MDAARAWAAGTLFPQSSGASGQRAGDTAMQDTPSDNALADARRFGLDTDGLKGLEDRQAPNRFAGIISVNAPVLAAFLAVASQWRTMLVATRHGLRHRVLGLDYAGARIALDALEISVTPHLWAGLQLMEQAATDALNDPDATGRGDLRP